LEREENRKLGFEMWILITTCLGECYNHNNDDEDDPHEVLKTTMANGDRNMKGVHLRLLE
jgi:hypothetical protein